MSILYCLITLGYLFFCSHAIGNNGTASQLPNHDPGTMIKSQEEFNLIPHKAEYDVSLAKDQNADVKDVKGKVHIKILDTGDGRVCEQQSQIIVYYQDGSGEIFLTTIVSWEKKDGSQYRFRIRTSRHGSAVRNMDETSEEDFVEEEPIEVQGEAYINPGSNGIVYFRQPSNMTPVVLPVNTIFPLHHLQNVLNAISKNQPALPGITVFDASSETLEPVTVNAVISNSFNPKLLLNQKIIDTTKAWNVGYALYPVGSQTDQPAEFEKKQIILPSGIISFSQMLWSGELVLDLKLAKLEVYEHP